VPERFTGQALVESMVGIGMEKVRVLFPRGDLAHSTVPEGITQAGAIVDEVEAYRTVAMTEIAPEMLSYLSANPVDVAIFLSPSSVRNLAVLLGKSITVLRSAVIACIGPVTARAVRELGLTVHVEPAESTITATVAAIERYLADRTPNGVVVSRSAGERSSL
ncbi:MAG: uroporphyrinogen-III synthase, partial [Thermomicrobiales bacterium]